MKKVDFNKLQAGDLVEVPRTQFAPMRRGWNGWLFSEAVVIRKGVGRTVSTAAYGADTTIYAAGTYWEMQDYKARKQ